MRRRSIRRFVCSGILPLALAWPAMAAGDQWLTRPVDDRTFKTFLDFFVYDRSLPLDLRVIGVNEEQGVRKERLSFLSTPGVRVFANLYRAAGAPSGPAIILLHGGSAGGKDSQATQVLAELLARAGWGVLAIDMQYFGERSTDLMTTFTEQEKHDRLYNQPSVYLAWVGQTVKDVGRSIDLLVEQRGADAKRIGLVGFSRGAIAGTIIGAAERRLAAVALVYGAHFDKLEREHLPAACPANYIGRISPRPVLMINGTMDADHIKDTSVEPLYRLAKNPRQMLWAETGHQLPTEQHRLAMVRWLRENLK